MQKKPVLPLSKGFTMIEVIVVIVLIGIMGIVAFSRFSNPGSFSQIAARDALISTIRTAQQTALGRQDVTFDIESNGGNWEFEVNSGTSPSINVITLKVDYDDVKLETGTADELGISTDNCASGTRFNDALSGFSIAFDMRGNISSFTNNAVTETMSSTFNGIRICVNDTLVDSVCVSRAGYAYSGDCDA